MNMPSSHRELFYHVTWSTKYRKPLIVPDVRPMLLSVMRNKARELGCWPYAVNVTDDHAHLLLYIPPSITIARVIREIKGISAYQLRMKIAGFKWQTGYGILSIRRREIPYVKAYIENQEEHHRN